jgi:Bacteriophage P22, NinX
VSTNLDHSFGSGFYFLQEKEMKISELSNEQLNYWVAITRGWEHLAADAFDEGGVWYFGSGKLPHCDSISREDYTPCSDWKQAGELIEEFKIDIYCTQAWPLQIQAEIHNPKPIQLSTQYGSTYMRAICKVVIAQKFGWTVPFGSHKDAPK